ncbi:TerD family protein [Nocardia sp. NPDC005978]|uniref:TerD family protein n=1 Tax=Nocardia sp. NPDC005978 TaxID=3156725 RepID=UPI0033B96EAA
MELTKGANAPLTTDEVVVEVNASTQVDVAALLLTAAGKVRSDHDFIFYNQPRGPGVTVQPPNRIRIATREVPADIDKIVVTASLDGSGPPNWGRAGRLQLALVDPLRRTTIATFTPSDLSTETAVVGLEIYRRQGSWKVRAVGQGYANGLAGIATDFGITVDDAPQPAPQASPYPPPANQYPPTAPFPATAPFPQQSYPPPQQPYPPPQQPYPPPQQPYAAPSQPYSPPPAYPPPQQYPPQSYPPPAQPAYPPPQQPYSLPPQQHSPTPGYPQQPAPRFGEATVSLDKGKVVSLSKNETVSLTKGGVATLTRVRMGLGWDPAKRGKSIDLDASVVAYDNRAKKLGKVWFVNLSEFRGAIKHSGDNLTGDGDGDDEVITVDLPALPANVYALLFTVNSYSGQKFDQISRAFCRLVDDYTGAELVRFELSRGDRRTGLFMCMLTRAANGWNMTALGDYGDGATVNAMVDPGKRFVTATVH